MARCLIGCGSNRGSRREYLDRAIELLRFMPGVAVQAVSRFRETSPIGGPPGQSSYLNGACLIDTDLTPWDVLAMLAAVEKTLHRERTERWGSRTIDLDLLLYDDAVIDTPELVVPHPRMATRRFVLEPAVEIAGELPFPSAGCTVRDLLDNITTASPLVAVVGIPGSGAPEVASTIADAVMGRVLHASAALPVADGGPRASLDRWRQTLAAWSKPLDRGRWSDVAVPSIADYWCDGLVVAASDQLDVDEFDRFRAEADTVVAGCVAPQVAIALVVDQASLEERIAFRARRSRDHTNVFADLAPAAVVCDRPAESVAELLRLQDRLLRRLRSAGDRGPRLPKAVITVQSGDLCRAAAEATAAVEAML